MRLFVFFMTCENNKIRVIKQYGIIDKNDYNLGGLKGA